MIFFAHTQIMQTMDTRPLLLSLNLLTMQPRKTCTQRDPVHIEKYAEQYRLSPTTILCIENSNKNREQEF